jgi:hypothetical protein
VDDAALVRFFQGFRDLPRDGDRLVHGDRSALQALPEVLALDQFHHQREHAVGGRLLEAVDGGDVGVIQGGEDLRLAAEAGDALRVQREGRGQHLERDLAAELRVARAQHLAHAARAERRDHVVTADSRHVPHPLPSP